MSFNTEECQVPENVIDLTGFIFRVKEVILIGENKKELVVSLSDFNAIYEEYVDPKDVEIARLLKIIKELEAPKGKKKRRSNTTPAEKQEIKELIERGYDLNEVCLSFDLNTSTIYKWIKDNNWDYKGRKRGGNS